MNAASIIDAISKSNTILIEAGGETYEVDFFSSEGLVADLDIPSEDEDREPGIFVDGVVALHGWDLRRATPGEDTNQFVVDDMVFSLLRYQPVEIRGHPAAIDDELRVQVEGARLCLSSNKVESSLRRVVGKKRADAIESLLLALRGEGVTMSESQLQNAIATTLDAIGNNE